MNAQECQGGKMPHSSHKSDDKEKNEDEADPEIFPIWCRISDMPHYPFQIRIK